ncbi:MAG: hypothetical protein EpisKO_30290 [Epibacterium sp.]
MATLLYLVHGPAVQQQQQLSYSVLSALKHGVDGVDLVLICDAANRRPDLPLRHVVISPEQIAQWTDGGRRPARAQLHALDLALRETGGPVCWASTDSAFTAAPARLLERITPETPLFFDRDGWLTSRPEWSPIIDACKDSALSEQIQPSTEVFDTGILGLSPSDLDFINRSLNPSEWAQNPYLVDNFEQIHLCALLAQNAQKLRFSHDLVQRYQGYMQHVYQGRLEAMFPPGGAVNTALAAQLPAITEPPKPLHLRLKAKAYALRRGLGHGTEFGYLAYLCAFAAPTPEGRSVWANIALDMMERSARAPQKLVKDLSNLAPEALPDAELSPQTEERWRRYWMNAGL